MYAGFFRATTHLSRALQIRLRRHPKASDSHATSASHITTRTLIAPKTTQSSFSTPRKGTKQEHLYYARYEKVMDRGRIASVDHNSTEKGRKDAPRKEIRPNGPTFRVFETHHKLEWHQSAMHYLCATMIARVEVSLRFRQRRVGR